MKFWCRTPGNKLDKAYEVNLFGSNRLRFDVVLLSFKFPVVVQASGCKADIYFEFIQLNL